MGGKSGSTKVPVTLYYGSLHFGICHGPVDSINKIFFNDKLGWGAGYITPGEPSTKPPLKKVEGFFVQVSDENGQLVRDQMQIRVAYNQSFAGAGAKVEWGEQQSGGVSVKRVRTVTRVLPVYDNNGGSDGNGPLIHVWMQASGEPDSNFLPTGYEDGSSDRVWFYPPGTWPSGEAPAPGGGGTPPVETQPVTEQTTISINAPEMFGGKLKEGGVSGLCHLMMGTIDQLVPENLANKVGRSTNTMPAYQGVANAWFYGSPSFYWSANSNRIPDVSIEVTRIPKGLPPELARIGNDANPAHIIYEVMTNQDWGMGSSPTQFDINSFNQAAQTLFNEKFGLSMMWSDQMEIEKFVSEVLDHIEASLFVHPRTGLFVLKLIRDDYDVTQLRDLNPDNAVLKNFQRKAWGETINEIVVTYKNPENEEDVSFAIQDTANIAMQGATITDNRNYYGIRLSELAARVAERDLRSASAPLCSCDIEVDRSAWDLTPGEVLKVTWPEYGLYGLVMRVGPVDYGRPGEPRIRASLVEDIFFMPAESFFVPPEGEWVDPRENAAPIPITKIISIPYYYLAQLLGITDETTANQPQYPETLAGVLGSTYQIDAQDFELMTPMADTVGNVSYQSVGTKELTGYALTKNELVREAISYLKVEFRTPKGGPVVGGFALLSDLDDRNSELVAIEAFDNDLGWRIRRGALDTVPRAWPKETAVRFIDENSDFIDDTLRADFDTVKYRLLTHTSLNTLDISEAPEETGTLNGRPHYPLRPANVRMNTVLWGRNVVDGQDGINLTWSTRSRLQETSVIQRWTDASVMVEPGQTTKVTFYDDEDNVIQVNAGLSTAAVSLPFTAIPGPSVKYRVESERDGLTSLQFVDHEFDVAGWGMNYGNYYGGKP
ncbi:hypothetical protein D3C87_855470 [compost metagenome]